MPRLIIKIVDKKQQVKIDALREPYKTGELDTFAILEAGMASGKDSIMLHVIDQNNESIIIQTSAKIISIAYNAMLGAQQQWAENKKP